MRAMTIATCDSMPLVRQLRPLTIFASQVPRMSGPVRGMSPDDRALASPAPARATMVARKPEVHRLPRNTTGKLEHGAPGPNDHSLLSQLLDVTKMFARRDATDARREILTGTKAAPTPGSEITGRAK